MKNLIQVMYPDESVHSYVIYSEQQTVERILETVFNEWNNGSGVECEQFLRSKKRSLSVNDIVCVNGAYFQCASMGWTPVDIAYVDALEKAVALSKYRNTSAYMALSEVMWDRSLPFPRSLVAA